MDNKTIYALSTVFGKSGVAVIRIVRMEYVPITAIRVFVLRFVAVTIVAAVDMLRVQPVIRSPRDPEG